MFLVTTADTRTWDRGARILFLGEWCRRFSERKTWEGLDYEVAPFHWDDRAKLYRDYLYLDSLYERCLNALIPVMNQEHGARYPARYWRIFAGPWLTIYLQFIFERFEAIRFVAERYSIEDTLVLAYDLKDMVMADMQDYIVRGINSDAFNHMLYAEALRTLNLFPWQSSPEPLNLAPPPATASGNGKRLTGLLKKFLAFPGRFNRLAFVSSYFYVPHQARLQLSLGQWPCLSPSDCRRPLGAVNIERRRALKLDFSAGSIFERYVADNILRFLPYSHLEGYGELRRGIETQPWPRRPSLILTAGNLTFADGFKLWAAEKTQVGSVLVSTQHGGHYGTGLWNTLEKHETAVSDVFVSSGWSEPGNPRILPLPSPRLLCNARLLRPAANGRILWVLTTFARHSFHLFSIPITSQVLGYLEQQFLFARGLKPEVRERILARLYPSNYGWDEEQRWRAAFPDLHFDRSRESMFRQASRCSLCIVTNNTTTLMETLAADYPTLAFWNPRHWELRPEALDAFDALRAAGVLHDTPESAARLANEVAQDPATWWRGSDVQRARKYFCERYAWISEDWLSRWKNALRDMERRPPSGTAP